MNQPGHTGNQWELLCSRPNWSKHWAVAGPYTFWKWHFDIVENREAKPCVIY